MSLKTNMLTLLLGSFFSYSPLKAKKMSHLDKLMSSNKINHNKQKKWLRFKLKMIPAQGSRLNKATKKKLIATETRTLRARFKGLGEFYLSGYYLNITSQMQG